MKNILKNKIIFFLNIILLVIVLFSCENPVTGNLEQKLTNSGNLEQKLTNLSDSRFNGDFVYFEYWRDGVEESTEYTSLDFNGSNKVWYYTCWKSYYIGSGWSYSGNYVGDSNSWHYEFEISNGMYRYKLWDNKHSNWSTWERYEFSNNDTTLTLYNYYKSLNFNYNNVLTKK